MSEAYRVEADAEGCARCAGGRTWTIVGPDGVAIGTSWGDQEFADDIADLMNMAYDAGKERSAPVSETVAGTERMRAALGWIAAQERHTFAECSLAEEIVSRARDALGPHRPCDCPPREGACKRGFNRTLGTTELSRCLLPADAPAVTETASASPYDPNPNAPKEWPGE